MASNCISEIEFFLLIFLSTQTYYYFAIIEDTTLRFIWIASFILTEKKIIGADFLVSLLAILEVFRRFVWNFFRLENEHLNNCGQFRAVRDISIAPIDSSDQTTILKMMDDPDGVINRWVFFYNFVEIFFFMIYALQLYKAKSPQDEKD